MQSMIEVPELEVEGMPNLPVIGQSPEAQRVANEEKLRRDMEVALRKEMSPPGALQLPEFLEARRWEFLIPDGYFEYHCLFDKVLLYQPDEHAKDAKFIEGGLLYMPEKTRAQEAERAPAGIIVSAGAVALDHLRSNGADLGHIVRFAMFSVLRVEVDCIEGRWFYGIPVRAGDIVASQDMEKQRRRGELKLVYEPTVNQHVIIRGDEQLPAPTLPKPNEF